MYQWTQSRQQFSIEELGAILLTKKVPKEKICHVQPTVVAHNATFVVDLNSLDDPKDVRADEGGVWKRMGTPIGYVSVHKSVKVIRRKRMRDLSNHYKISRTYYRLASSPDFRRIITTAHGML